MKKLLLLILLASGHLSHAQDYTSYFTGNEEDVSPETLGGIVLMGGATENDAAMQWFLQKANGGDVLVIRASGSDGYNDYLYTELGVPVNSVESIVLNNAAAANDPYVIAQIENAEALWIAGGNQWTYVNEWRGEGVEDAINYLLNDKGAVVGGTSAGMAVLGGSYFSAENGSIQSATALNNPFHNNVTLGHGDFLHAPFLEHVVTDQHYNNPDRRGRHVTFMARMENDLGIEAYGIASDEYTAVCIEPDGTARAFGDYPEYEDYVYFLASNCQEEGPEIIENDTPLTWNRDNRAIKVYKVPASNGENYFDLVNWQQGEGGTWQDWWVENGELMVNESAEAPDCITGVEESLSGEWQVFPTLSNGIVNIHGTAPGWNWQLFNMSGERVRSGKTVRTEDQLRLNDVPAGMYVLQISSETLRSTHKIILQ